MNKSNYSLDISQAPVYQKQVEGISYSNAKRIVAFLARYGIFIFFGIFYLIVTILRPAFITLDNIYDILTEVSLISFVAFGEAIVIAAGAVDMSVGNIAGYGALLTCYLLTQTELGIAPSIAIGTATGCLIGAINGFFVSRLYMNSLVATLGTMFVLVGMLYMLTFGQSIMMLPESFTNLGTDTFLSVPYPIYAMALGFLICHLFMEKTKYGRNIQMIGGNIEACRLSGINTKNITLSAFLIAGFLSALSGILLASKQGMANVDMGERFLLQAFTAAMLGTVIFNGKKLIVGTIFGTIFLVSLINGLTLLGAGPQWIYFAQGALLMSAILLNFYSKKINRTFA